MTLFNEDQVRKRMAAPSGLLGIDVYNGDGPIKWSALKGANRYYAWIKATEGGDFQDKSFATNRNGAHDAGVIPGAYHFFRPKTAVQTQIDNFCDTVGEMRIGELPPSLDLEVPEQWKKLDPKAVEEHKTDWMAIAMENRMKIVLQWLEAVEKRLGIRPIIYAGKDFVDEILGNDPRLAKYLLWLPRYAEVAEIPEPWTRYTWWQYSEHGSIPEVTSHELDLNTFAGTLDELKALCFGAQARTDETEIADAAKPWYLRCPFVRWVCRFFGCGK